MNAEPNLTVEESVKGSAELTPKPESRAIPKLVCTLQTLDTTAATAQRLLEHSTCPSSRHVGEV